MKLETAVKRFLTVIERDAAFGYTTWDGKKWHWNEEIWKDNDPEYYKHWKRLSDLVGGVPLSPVRKK